MHDFIPYSAIYHLFSNTLHTKCMQMYGQKRANDAAHWYMAELSSRVVAESGRPSDRHHLGKLILQSLKDAPNFIAQIDGAIDESETNSSVLERSVRCAISLKNMGLKVGDVLVLMVPNYLDLAILFKAALYHGIAIAPVDWNFTLDQLKETFGRYKPRMVFCESVKAPDVQLTLNEVESDAYIITVDKGDYLCSFSEFLEKYGNDTLDDEFKATDFDSEKTIAIIIPSSGATGLSKGSVATHKNFAIALPYFWFRFTKFPTPITKAFLASPLQYLTAVMHFVAAPIFRYTRLQSSLPLSVDTVFNLINTHMPQYLIMSPTMMQLFIAPGNRERCDFTCFDTIIVGGSPVPPELITDFKEISPNTEMVNTYAITEQTCLGFNTDNPPPSSCGKAMGLFQYRLIDVETLEDILEPNVQGELWIKGPSIFKGYYNNPEATAQAFAEDGWFKTGDIFYRDENYNFFFVERYKIHQGTFALAKLV